MPLDPQPFAGPLLVTFAYLGLYYAFILHILRVKNRLKAAYAEQGKKFDRYGDDREMLAADRYQLNMLEHMGPFLALLWLNAVFVGPVGATAAGGVYLLARAAYPFAMGQRLGRGVRGAIMAATMPGYLVLVYLAGRLVVALLG